LFDSYPLRARRWGGWSWHGRSFVDNRAWDSGRMSTRQHRVHRIHVSSAPMPPSSLAPARSRLHHRTKQGTPPALLIWAVWIPTLRRTQKTRYRVSAGSGSAVAGGHQGRSSNPQKRRNLRFAGARSRATLVPVSRSAWPAKVHVSEGSGISKSPELRSHEAEIRCALARPNRSNRPRERMYRPFIVGHCHARAARPNRGLSLSSVGA